MSQFIEKLEYFIFIFFLYNLISIKEIELNLITFERNQSKKKNPLVVLALLVITRSKAASLLVHQEEESRTIKSPLCFIRSRKSYERYN